MWQNRITDQLGISLPFVGAGMAIVGGADLTAAVSDAGGIGLFCQGPGAPAVLAKEIENIRALTARPFGVDFIVENTAFGPTTDEAHIEVAARYRVPLAVFFWNPPELRWISRLRDAGSLVWGTAYSVSSARRLKSLGVDAIIVQSCEAGGHVRAELTASELLPAVRAVIPEVPLISAGGIVDGASAAAAFRSGADAVCVGTRLVASEESLASDDYKRRILAAAGTDTTITRIFGPEWPDAPMRVIRNRAVERAERGNKPPASAIGETQVFGQHYVMPPHSAVLPTRSTRGDHEEMCLAAGAGVTSIHQVLPARKIVQDIMADARHRLAAQHTRGHSSRFPPGME